MKNLMFLTNVNFLELKSVWPVLMIILILIVSFVFHKYYASLKKELYSFVTKNEINNIISFLEENKEKYDIDPRIIKIIFNKCKTLTEKIKIYNLLIEIKSIWKLYFEEETQIINSIRDDIRSEIKKKIISGELKLEECKLSHDFCQKFFAENKNEHDLIYEAWKGLCRKRINFLAQKGDIEDFQTLLLFIPKKESGLREIINIKMEDLKAVSH